LTLNGIPLRSDAAIVEAVLAAAATARAAASDGAAAPPPLAAAPPPPAAPPSFFGGGGPRGLLGTPYVVNYSLAPSADAAAAAAASGDACAGAAGGAGAAAGGVVVRSRAMARLGRGALAGDVDRLGLAGAAAGMLKLVGVLEAVNSDLPAGHPCRVKIIMMIIVMIIMIIMMMMMMIMKYSTALKIRAMPANKTCRL
jgi:hypothetical protein